MGGPALLVYFGTLPPTVLSLLQPTRRTELSRVAAMVPGCPCADLGL